MSNTDPEFHWVQLIKSRLLKDEKEFAIFLPLCAGVGLIGLTGVNGVQQCFQVG